MPVRHLHHRRSFKLANEILELRVRCPRDVIDFHDRDFVGKAQDLGEDTTNRINFHRGHRPGDNNPEHHPVKRRLHHLKLPDRCDPRPTILGKTRPVLGAVGEPEHVSRPADDAFQHGKPTAARAFPTKGCIISDFVPDERHR